MEPHPVTHGALDEAELAQFGVRPDQVIDFSSNINPFGPPAAVLAALRALDPAPIPTGVACACGNSWLCATAVALRR